MIQNIVVGLIVTLAFLFFMNRVLPQTWLRVIRSRLPFGMARVATKSAQGGCSQCSGGCSKK